MPRGGQAGAYAPIALGLVAAVLYLVRKIYAEVGSALPLYFVIAVAVVVVGVPHVEALARLLGAVVGAGWLEMPIDVLPVRAAGQAASYLHVATPFALDARAAGRPPATPRCGGQVLIGFDPLLVVLAGAPSSARSELTGRGLVERPG